MKSLLFALAGIMLISQTTAQVNGGILKAVVNGSRVILNDDTATRNCGSRYQMKVSFDGHHITWLQYDIGEYAGCDCNFNYSVTLDSLAGGHYNTDLFYSYVVPIGVPPWYVTWDTLYAGSVEFDIVNSFSQNPVKTDSAESDCFPVGVNNTRETRDVIGACFPNPFRSVTKIPVLHHQAGDYLEVFNQFGVIRRIDLNLPDKYLQCDLSLFSPGIYFYRLNSERHTSAIYRMILIK
jgi:hypothetical protein